MSEELQTRRVEVRCVGRPPAARVERAAGVSNVGVDGELLRCSVTGSFQPFLESLRGYEVISLTTEADSPRTPTLTGDPGLHPRSGPAMRTHILNARVAGVLFICATAASLVDRALLSPVLGGSDYLAATFANQDRVVAGAFFQVVAGLTSAGIAMALYPVLRRHAEGLAIGSVALRLLEGTMYIVGAVGALLLVALSQQLASAAATPSSAMTTSGALLLALRDRASEIGILAFYLGGTMYYYIFLRTRLIPRWLSSWGILGTTLGLVAAVLVFSGALGLFSPLQIAMNLPIFLNEMVLAVWLIIKGFAAPAAIPKSAAPRSPATLSL